MRKVEAVGNDKAWKGRASNARPDQQKQVNSKFERLPGSWRVKFG
jgi:hypothetical protein